MIYIPVIIGDSTGREVGTQEWQFRTLGTWLTRSLSCANAFRFACMLRYSFRRMSMSSLLSPPSLSPLSLLIRLGSGVEIPRTLAWLHKVQAKVSRENWVVVYFLLLSAERNFKLATQLPNLQKLLPDHPPPRLFGRQPNHQRDVQEGVVRERSDTEARG